MTQSPIGYKVKKARNKVLGRMLSTLRKSFTGRMTMVHLVRD